MEITEINMLSDFEAGMKCLQNPSLISRLPPLPQLYGFCKWGALFFAFFATFTSLLRKIKLLTIRRINSWVSPAQPLLNQLLSGGDDDFDFSDDDDDDDVSSSCSVSDDDEEDEEIDYTSSFNDWNGDQSQNDEEFSDGSDQNGVCGLRRRNGFSWSDFSAGKSVVKLWDSFGFALDFDDNDFDDNEDDSSLDFTGGSVRMSNILNGKKIPSVILSADLNENKSVVFGAYDTRMGRRESPAICAEWRPRRANVAGGVGQGGINEVYVNGALTIGDLRNVKTPLEN